MRTFIVFILFSFTNSYAQDKIFEQVWSTDIQYCGHKEEQGMPIIDNDKIFHLFGFDYFINSTNGEKVYFTSDSAKHFFQSQEYNTFYII